MGSVDRISKLPPNVTNHILQLVTLKDAARTSILSTEWIYKWTLSPKLILDHSFFCSVINKYNKPIASIHDGYLDGRILEYSNIVNNILFSRNGPIHEFFLDLPSWLPHKQDITYCLHFLSTKSVHELYLYNSSDDRKLPWWMFSCAGFANLTSLTLVNWIVPSLSTTCSGFPCIIRLTLYSSCGNAVETLVSKCPRLENLFLEIINENSRLNIHSPKLQCLTVEGSVSGVFLKESKSIKKLFLWCRLQHKWDHTIELFNCFPLLEELVLGSEFCSALDMSIVGDCCYEHLQTAYISITTYGIALELIEKILSSSPVLKTITIHVDLEDEEILKLAKKLLRYRHTSTAEIIFE